MAIATLADIVRLHAIERPDRTAMIFTADNRRWTFSELDQESNRMAQALRASGVNAQDRIAYLDKNSPEYFTFLYGGAKLNAVSVAVNWRLAPPEMEYILNNSEASFLLIGEEFLESLAQMNLTHAKTIVVLGDPLEGVVGDRFKPIACDAGTTSLVNGSRVIIGFSRDLKPAGSWGPATSAHATSCKATTSTRGGTPSKFCFCS